MDSTPPEHVLRLFGADGDPVRLEGGQGTTFRAGAIVLKPVSDVEEANWISELFARLEGPGFRVPAPVPARDGAWVADGWSASRYVDATHAGRNGGRWPETIGACRAFHSALRGVVQPAFIARAEHPWAFADRLAWGELKMEPLAAFAPVIARLRTLLRPVPAENQVIHGDFTANVLFAEGEAPCVIDFSPYWRPAAFAQAVVVGDAISWTGADPAIVDLCADIPEFGQYFARALLRRVWELDQHTRRGRPRMEALLGEFIPTVRLLEQLLQ
ncbi:MAG: aminoglycoside phosphotransferase [bacterium]